MPFGANTQNRSARPHLALDEALAARAEKAPDAPASPDFRDAAPDGSDRPDDRLRVLSQRQLNRLVFVAAEVGARFGREGSGLDPASWMYAGLPLFDGRTAMDACRDRAAFLKAMVVHGAGMPLDVDAGEMDDALDEAMELLSDEEVDYDAIVSPAVRSCGTLASLADFGVGEPELYTAASVLEGSDGTTYSFAAFLAADREEATGRMRARFGQAADAAVLTRGFDPSEPVAMSLLSEPLVDALIDAAADAGSPMADGLDVFVEHRFAA
jgi:hypothetical protein